MGGQLRLTEEQLAAIAKKLKAHKIRPMGADIPAHRVVLKGGDPGKQAGHKKGGKSDYEGMLVQQIHFAGLPAPKREYKFGAAEGRRWRADLAYPDLMLLVEIDGAVHRIKERFNGDMEKSQAAFRLGWRVLRVSPIQVKNGRALQLIEQALTALAAGVPALRT